MKCIYELNIVFIELLLYFYLREMDEIFKFLVFYDWEKIKRIDKNRMLDLIELVLKIFNGEVIGYFDIIELENKLV